MSRKSRKCEFISTAPKNERTFLLKSRKELEALPKESTEIEADNSIKRYSRRHEALEDYCLADFVSKIVSVTNIKQRHDQECKDDDDFTDCDEEEPNEMTSAPQEVPNTSKLRYSVTKGNVRIVLRKNTKVLRYVHYSEKVDSENYYREQLMLFHPWRNEEQDLLNGFKSFKDHFKAIKKEIQIKKAEYDASYEVLEEIEKAVETGTIDCFDDICPNIESVEANDAHIDPSASTSYAFYCPQSHKHAYHDLGSDIGLMSQIQPDDIQIIQTRLPEKDFLELLSRLNAKQREMFTHVIHSLTQKPGEQLCIFYHRRCRCRKVCPNSHFISSTS